MINLMPILILPTLLLPNNLVLVLTIPTLIVLSYMGLMPIFEFGDASLEVYDFIIILISLKLFARLSLLKASMNIQSVHRQIGIFLIVLMGATFIAFSRFGTEIFLSELFSFFRFVVFIGVFFLLYYSISTTENLKLSCKYFEIAGLAIGLSVYASIVLYLFTGINFGEVQDTEGMVRYFGPIGDQIGFIIALFCIKELVEGNIFRALFYSGAILATGTRSAFITLLVGSLLVMVRKRINSHYRWSRFAIFLGMIGLLLGFSNLLLVRFTDIEIFSVGFSQRTLAMMLGLQVFLDNILTGVGFSGFRFAIYAYNTETAFTNFAYDYVANTSNQFLQTATDAGIPGLIAFVFLVKSCLSTLNVASVVSLDELKIFFIAGRIWLISLLVGNQTAAWMLPGSLITYLFWVLLALAASGVRLYELNSGRSQIQTNMSHKHHL